MPIGCGNTAYLLEISFFRILDTSRRCPLIFDPSLNATSSAAVKAMLAARRILNALRGSIKKHGPLSDRLIVAISGGQDSVALAGALGELSASGFLRSSISIALVHCNHGWPGDDSAAAHVALLSTQLRIPLTVIRGRDVPITEAGAREWRYASLCIAADDMGTRDVLVAHTRTDLAETALLNIVAGAGADGVGAMRAERYLSPRHRILRPLLSVTRADTAAFCDSRNLPIWNDPYNQADFARNRVRSRVMPLLRRELNPQVERALARNAQLLRDDADALEVISAEAFGGSVHVEDDTVVVSRALVRKLPRALQRRVFRRVLAVVAKEGSHPCSFAHVEALCSLLHKPAGARALSLQGGAEARVDDNDRVVLSGGFIDCKSSPSMLNPP